MFEEPTPPSEEITIALEEESIRLYKLSSSPIVGMPLLDWYKSLTSTKTLYDGAAEILERKEIELAGIKGIQLKTLFDTQTIVIYLPRFDSVFRVVIDPAGAIENPEIDKILSTLRFTN